MRKPHCTEQALLKRRDVIKGGAVVLASAFFPFSIEILNAGSAVAAPPAPSGTGEERILWNSCNVNCGSRCALRVHVKDGVITRVETDNTGDDRYGMQQLRACPRGRSMRQRIYAEQRIPYPLRRVGNRGEGKFERISWEEAFKEIGQRLRGTIDTYGNEAVYLNYGTGALGSTMGKSWPPAATPVARLMNLVGGYLNHYSDYSTCQITVGMPYLYGGSWVDGNSLSDMENSELAVFFGNNPSETRMSGCKAKTLQHARFTRNTRVIIIDPRYTDSMVSVGDEWIPIRPGTDAALSAALAYVMITEDLIDKPFLAKYTIGYDEESLPKGAPAGSSYKSYILGQGPDKTPKTPAWASRITGIPPARIEKLAREIAGARPCFICQGWGPQRTTNGENISRAIGMLAVLTGNVGIKGGNTGARENAGYKLPMATFPTLENPVKTELSCFNWYQAIDDYKQMTATTAGIRGRERLIAPIKFIWNYAGNCVTRQTVLCTTPFSFGMKKLGKSILWHTVCINKKAGACSRLFVYAVFIRSAAILAYSGESSMPTHLLPVAFAARAVEPPPRKGSSTVPPSGTTPMSSAMSGIGLLVRWTFSALFTGYLKTPGRHWLVFR